MNRVRNQKEVVNLGLCPNRGGVRTINPRVPTCILKMGTEKGQLKKIKVGSQFCGGGGSGNLGQIPNFNTFFIKEGVPVKKTPKLGTLSQVAQPPPLLTWDAYYFFRKKS